MRKTTAADVVGARVTGVIAEAARHGVMAVVLAVVADKDGVKDGRRAETDRPEAVALADRAAMSAGDHGREVIVTGAAEVKARSGSGRRFRRTSV
jgi:hypothetical protein